MSMPNQECWVIKNQDGYYVNPRFRALFSGHATGFTFFTIEETAKKRLGKLGEGYYLEYVNLNDIPDGERVYT